MKFIGLYNSVDRDNDPMLLIEDVLDTLVEVGNGVTDEHLHEAADKLFKARDILEKLELPPPQVPVSATGHEIQDTSVIYRPYCEMCGHRLRSMEINLNGARPKTPSDAMSNFARFTPTTCPRCGRLFTSAQVPLKYSEKDE